jgi:hypothetical protein
MAAATRSENRVLFDPSIRAQLGYDTNVFRTDTATGDAFTRAGASMTFEYRGPKNRLTARLDGSHKFYQEFNQADESEVYSDITASRSLGSAVAGVALRSSYARLRLLDREGNFLPRSSFSSFSNRLLGFADLSLTKNLYLGAEFGYRIKNYEETRGLRSLDYTEPAAEVGLTQYLPKRLSLRLEGTWDERDYDERLAAGADGTVPPSNPLLTLRGLGVQSRIRKRWGTRGLLEASLGFRRSKDLFQDELSYDQRSADARASLPFGRWAVALRGAVVARDFDIRATGGSGPLEEDFLSVRADLERGLWAGAVLVGGYSLFRRSTNDPAGEYDIDTWQLGVVHIF